MDGSGGGSYLELGGACPPTPVSPPLDDGKDCRAQFVQLENTAIECLCADKDEEERWR